MKKIIIGIHGLKNKPPEDVLKKWWQEAIAEGFKLNNINSGKFRFDLVYWADLNYETPENPDEWDENNPEYLSSPYTPYEESEFNKVKEQLKRGINKTIESGLDLLFLRDGEISGFDKIADIAIKKMFSDLYIYYTGDCVAKPGINAKKEFRLRLLEKLEKYKKYHIMLIAHSMGSIIAYDTLMEINKKYKIDYFITIGSPLGLPVVIKKILIEQKKNIGGEPILPDNEIFQFSNTMLQNEQEDSFFNNKIIHDSRADGEVGNNVIQHIHDSNEIILPTPETIIKKWYNLSDIDDRVALVGNLEKKFAVSSREIKPSDITVRNNYIYKGKSNPHKVYGYLRSPEFSKIAYEFITGKKSLLQKIKDFFIKKNIFNKK